jgi:hypothetical protein
LTVEAPGSPAAGLHAFFEIEPYREYETMVASGHTGATIPSLLAEARAAYRASDDQYRQTLLARFQQVEDEIVTPRVLGGEPA